MFLTFTPTQMKRERERKGQRKTARTFSVFHALGIRHSGSDRNLAKWDKIIKLEGALLSFSAKWIKCCRRVAADPPQDPKTLAGVQTL